MHNFPKVKSNPGFVHLKAKNMPVSLHGYVFVDVQDSTFWEKRNLQKLAFVVPIDTEVSS
jgi:hypothetical protein